MELKERYPSFVWNKRRSLELMLSQNAKSITDNCPSKRLVLPLYLYGNKFVTHIGAMEMTWAATFAGPGWSYTRRQKLKEVSHSGHKLQISHE